MAPRQQHAAHAALGKRENAPDTYASKASPAWRPVQPPRAVESSLASGATRVQGGRGERRRRRCWPATRLPAAAARRLTQRWGSSSGTDMISFCLEACGTSMVTVCSLRALPQQMSSVGLSRVRAHHCISHLRQTRHTCRQVRVRKRLECAQNTDHLRRGSRKRCSHSGQTGRGKRGHTVHTCTSCSAACLPEMDSVASPPPFLLIAFRLLFPPPRSPRTSTPAS